MLHRMTRDHDTPERRMTDFVVVAKLPCPDKNIFLREARNFLVVTVLRDEQTRESHASGKCDPLSLGRSGTIRERPGLSSSDPADILGDTFASLQSPVWSTLPGVAEGNLTLPVFLSP